MAWQVSDPRSGQDLVLLLPRVMPAGELHVDRWLQRVRKAARLDHPRLAPALEVGVHDGWPYVTYELGERVGAGDSEQYQWRDNSRATVRCTFAGGKLTHWELLRT